MKKQEQNRPTHDQIIHTKSKTTLPGKYSIKSTNIVQQSKSNQIEECPEALIDKETKHYRFTPIIATASKLVIMQMLPSFRYVSVYCSSMFWVILN